jgi:hypothetical protein
VVLSGSLKISCPGQEVQSLNSKAITWALAKDLYGPKGPYFIIPMSLFIGAAATTVHWAIARRWKYIGPVKTEDVLLPVIFMYMGWLYAGVNSQILSGVVIGVASQIFLRKRHPGR